MNTLNFVNQYELINHQLSPLTKFCNLRSEFFNKGICWTDSIDGKFNEYSKFRVILYLKKHTNNIDFNNPIITECNGLVLEYSYNNKWKILVIPNPNCTKVNISMNQVNKYFQEKKYKIYDILDATIINIYYYEGAWRISTCKGYEVNNLTFINDKSYAKVFSDIISITCPKYNMNNLNIKYCYTFAIRTTEFHLFNETKHLQNCEIENNYVKLLKVCDLTNCLELDINKENIEIPIYNPIDIKNANSINVLMNYAKNSYIKYAKGYETNNFKFKPLYGYILRSTSNNIPRAYRNIMITSSLFSTIKQCVYSNIKTNDINYMIVNMFIDKKRKYQYCILFDQYKIQFSKLEKIIIDICKNVSCLLIKDINNNIPNPSYNNLCKKIINSINSSNIIKDINSVELTKSSHDIILSIIYDYVHNQDYIEDLVKLLTEY